MQYPMQNRAAVSRRDDGITLIALYHFLVSLLFLAGTVVLAVPGLILAIVAATEAPPAFIGMAVIGALACVTMAFTLLYLIVGYGLWTLRQWARVTALALAMLSLLNVPVGTVAGGLTIWHLLKPEVAARFDQND